MRNKIIRVDESEEEIVGEPTQIIRDGVKTEIVKFNIMSIAHLIGAEALDTVNLRDGRVMLVDDNGHEKGLPVNPKATVLYWAVCRPGTTHPIVGDVAVVYDDDFE